MNARLNVEKFLPITLATMPWRLSAYLSGVIVIVVGIGHGDTSSDPGRD